MLPDNKTFDLGFDESNCKDLFSSMNFFSSGTIVIVASSDFTNLSKEYFSSSM